MSSSENLPWKNGYWFNKKSPVFITHVENEDSTVKNLIYFDNPEVKDLAKSKWKSGDFGKARDDFIEMTGIQNYNMKIEIGDMFNMHGKRCFT